MVWMTKDINRVGLAQYVIRSRTNPAKGHVVVRNRNFAWQCDCKSAMFRGKCRHISQARGYETAVECGYDVPGLEEVEYYRAVEDGKEDRARRGIPIAPP